MAKNSSNRSRNNNPTGRNQYSGGWMDAAKDRPMTTAAAAAAAVGAGVFLWSKRNQISEQLSNLSDQISDWTESMRSNEQDERIRERGMQPIDATGAEVRDPPVSAGRRSSEVRRGSANR